MLLVRAGAAQHRLGRAGGRAGWRAGGRAGARRRRRAAAARRGAVLRHRVQADAEAVVAHARGPLTGERGRGSRQDARGRRRGVGNDGSRVARACLRRAPRRGRWRGVLRSLDVKRNAARRQPALVQRVGSRPLDRLQVLESVPELAPRTGLRVCLHLHPYARAPLMRVPQALAKRVILHGEQIVRCRASPRRAEQLVPCAPSSMKCILRRCWRGRPDARRQDGRRATMNGNQRRFTGRGPLLGAKQGLWENAWHGGCRWKIRRCRVLPS